MEPLVLSNDDKMWDFDGAQIQEWWVIHLLVVRHYSICLNIKKIIRDIHSMHTLIRSFKWVAVIYWISKTYEDILLESIIWRWNCTYYVVIFYQTKTIRSTAAWVLYKVKTQAGKSSMYKNGPVKFHNLDHSI